MDRATTSSDSPSWGPAPIAVYVAMFGATLGGQGAGMLVDALIVRRRLVWIPMTCSVVLEALVGARSAAKRLGRPLTGAECARVSAYYSTALAVVSFPLALWSLAANRPGVGRSPVDVVALLGFGLAALLVATGVRVALLSLWSGRRP